MKRNNLILMILLGLFMSSCAAVFSPEAEENLFTLLSNRIQVTRSGAQLNLGVGLKDSASGESTNAVVTLDGSLEEDEFVFVCYGDANNMPFEVMKDAADMFFAGINGGQRTSAYFTVQSREMCLVRYPAGGLTCVAPSTSTTYCSENRGVSQELVNGPNQLILPIPPFASDGVLFRARFALTSESRAATAIGNTIEPQAIPAISAPTQSIEAAALGMATTNLGDFIAFHYIDGDGDEDLTVAGTNEVGILLNNNGTFGLETIVTMDPALIGATIQGLLLGDFDGNGSADLAVSLSGVLGIEWRTLICFYMDINNAGSTLADYNVGLSFAQSNTLAGDMKILTDNGVNYLVISEPSMQNDRDEVVGGIYIMPFSDFITRTGLVELDLNNYGIVIGTQEFCNGGRTFQIIGNLITAVECNNANEQTYSLAVLNRAGEKLNTYLGSYYGSKNGIAVSMSYLDSLLFVEAGSSTINLATIESFQLSSAGQFSSIDQTVWGDGREGAEVQGLSVTSAGYFDGWPVVLAGGTLNVANRGFAILMDQIAGNFGGEIITFNVPDGMSVAGRGSFGRSLAVSNDSTLVIGAPLQDNGTIYTYR